MFSQLATRKRASAKIKRIFSWLSEFESCCQFLVAAVIIFIKRRYYLYEITYAPQFRTTFSAFLPTHIHHLLARLIIHNAVTTYRHLLNELCDQLQTRPLGDLCFLCALGDLGALGDFG